MLLPGNRLFVAFPTRRSSDLLARAGAEQNQLGLEREQPLEVGFGERVESRHAPGDHRLLGNDEQRAGMALAVDRSEEHTSELQSREKLVCRLLHEKKKLRMQQ